MTSQISLKLNFLKKTLSRKREAPSRKKILSKCLSDQRLACEIYKGFINLNTDKRNDLNRNRGGVDWSGGMERRWGREREKRREGKLRLGCKIN